MKITKLITIALFITSCSANEKVGYYKGYELPPYIVNQSIDKIQLRQYKPQILAEVSVSGNRDEAVRKGFRILANYIFGDNTVNQNVSMTTPVVQKSVSKKIAMTTPVNQIAKADKWLIQFGMPKKYKFDTLPKPNDKRIRFIMSEPKNVVSITFSGRWSDELFKEKEIKLEQFIQSRKLTQISEPSYAYYDDPFTLPWNRRNEIII